MKKYLAFLCLIVVVFMGITVSAYAIDDELVGSARALDELGLFSGIGTAENGYPIYALDRGPTRQEAIAMLVRLMGKENEAMNKEWSMPFTDVDKWAKPYVGYAYANGLTSGTSETTFSGNDTVTASEYLTLILRFLGYSDKNGDFSWDQSWVLSDKIGLTDGRYNANTKKFTRGDAALISFHAIGMYRKGNGASEIIVQSTPKGRVYSRFPKILSFDNVTDFAPFEHSFDIEDTVYYYYSANTLPFAEQFAKDYAYWLKSKGYSLIREEDDPMVNQYKGSDIVYELINPSNEYKITIHTAIDGGSSGDGYNNNFTYDISVEISPTKSQKVPQDVLGKIRTHLVYAGKSDQQGIVYCMSTLTANSAYYGAYYAGMGQNCFVDAAKEYQIIANLCEGYPELDEFRAYILTLYAIDLASGEAVTLTAYNYLDYAVIVCEGSTNMADLYEKAFEELNRIMGD
ncbi:MAG: S-layer homology domain-containing protein [Peptococcaceae bacterium]|nr:S-layer homology domain-containing protein [Peptococcaceae bacterium]